MCGLQSDQYERGAVSHFTEDQSVRVIDAKNCLTGQKAVPGLIYVSKWWLLFNILTPPRVQVSNSTCLRIYWQRSVIMSSMQQKYSLKHHINTPSQTYMLSRMHYCTNRYISQLRCKESGSWTNTSFQLFYLSSFLLPVCSFSPCSLHQCEVRWPL